MADLRAADGKTVPQGGSEDRATWWTCGLCDFTGPNVGSDTFGRRLCLGSCGGTIRNTNVPRVTAPRAGEGSDGK